MLSLPTHAHVHTEHTASVWTAQSRLIQQPCSVVKHQLSSTFLLGHLQCAHCKFTLPTLIRWLPQLQASQAIITKLLFLWIGPLLQKEIVPSRFQQTLPHDLLAVLALNLNSPEMWGREWMDSRTKSRLRED